MTGVQTCALPIWLKDRIKSGDVVVRHCPTLAMLADFFTKPLEGNLFRKFRDVLLGQAHVDSLARNFVDPLKERVGDSVTVHHENNATGIVDTGNSGTVPDTVAKVTWVDVVKKTPAAATTTSVIATSGGGQNASRPLFLQQHRKPVLRSLSQNNPVNASKV